MFIFVFGSLNNLQAASLASTEFVNITPVGEKKDMSQPMARAYQPRAVEAAWYSWWEKQGYFHANAKDALNKDDDDKFIMVIPPPNVTGSLHVGHALTGAIEDALTRYHRMHGKSVVWLPGVDHAGIASQVVVEKQIKRESNLTRHDLGREKFVERVWQWKEKYENLILNQIKKMGGSVDWERYKFTLSPELSEAVNEAFCRFYEQGLIYRDTRLVNWCPTLCTAISNVEVDSTDIPAYHKVKIPGYSEPVEFGVLTKFAYKLIREDGTVSDEEELVVATTRLETMLGDVAVAVHPKDERYKKLIGKKLQHPFVQRQLDVIGDDILVDMNFGTGAVKVTPAHDQNDFDCGRRNKLPEIIVLTDEGLMANNCGEFSSQPRYTARLNIEKALETKGLLRGKEPNPMSLGFCSRSGDVVEPMLKPQWWMNCEDLARRSVEAVEKGELRIVPEEFNKTWYQWLKNIRPWCISRQLWWGHRIPAYKATLRKHNNVSETGDEQIWVVGRSQDEARLRAAEQMKIPADRASEIVLEQDEDVLDTWFSSGLFPFSTFGWPNIENPDFKAFYPGTILETGHDILFFWVARMVMMGLGLTNKLPFRTVLLHSMVRDKNGRKMSKSLGNVIDPLDVIDGVALAKMNERLTKSNLAKVEIDHAVAENKKLYPKGIPECGSDALRFGLLAYTAQARNINLDIARVIGYRNFCNKLWNATKFALMNLGENFSFEETRFETALQSDDMANRWMISRLNTTVADVNKNLTSYDFAEAVTSAYNFWLYDLCGIYLENMKPIMRGSDDERKASCRHILYRCLDAGLRMLHPMMPFVTEELFQRLPGVCHDSICIAPYPVEDSKLNFPEAVECMDSTMAIVKAVRLVKSEYTLEPSATPEVFIIGSDEKEAVPSYIEALAPCGKVSITSDQNSIPRGCAVKLLEKTEVHVLISGLINFKQEIAKLDARVAEKDLLVKKYEEKMKQPDYEDRVPEKIRIEWTKSKGQYEEEIESIKTLTDKFKSLLTN